MSELINNSEKRKELLKALILKLHEGEKVEDVRSELVNLMKKVPYGDVVEVEQQLINEGRLSEQEVLRFCDLHTQALEGHIDLSGMQIVPPGHPVDTFKKENKELLKVVGQVNGKFSEFGPDKDIPGYFLELKGLYNQLMDVDKHYLRKENLLFPYLEKHGITGPPKVMWGKHDETRDLLKASIEILDNPEGLTHEEVESAIVLVLRPAAAAVSDMVTKEEQILFPMTMDKLTDLEWYDIHEQTLDIGFCLYDPDVEWKPAEVLREKAKEERDDDIVRLPSGSFTKDELEAILNALPVDITFVDRNDKVKYFSQGKERIFHRSRAILNRDVKMCHPPSSVGIVDRILQDFHSGKEDHAAFWIQMKGSFISIEYFALRDEKGNFLGTLEASQNLTEKRKLEGEQRILSYSKNK